MGAFTQKRTFKTLVEEATTTPTRGAGDAGGTLLKVRMRAGVDFARGAHRFSSISGRFPTGNPQVVARTNLEVGADRPCRPRIPNLPHKPRVDCR